jgi:drug/metabolite transporter (DMT)-like permease
VVILLALAAAVLYGSGDFIGGAASRTAHVLSVLRLSTPAGAVVVILAALASGGPAGVAGLAWGAAAGAIGGLGLMIFFAGLSSGPMSVIAPVSGLVSTVLPVGVALAGGERPGPPVYAGAALCLVAIVLASSTGRAREAAAPGRLGPVGAVAYGVASGASFGLFFLFIRNGGQSGALWPIVAARLSELAVVLIAVAVVRPGALPRAGSGRRLVLAVVGSGVIDSVANVCYVAATRAGLFGLAVVLTSLYPGVTVLLARIVLGERLRWVQRAGLGLAALGIVLVAV